jgi:putative methionine-R-sulfoxide reductase with GAF domain/ligand-binding sensor domain-containing protein
LVFVPVPPYNKSYISVLKKTVFTYCWLLLFAWQAKSQLLDYHVQMMVKKTGLVHANQVDEMMRDIKGFLWLLTPTKAQRFDGKNILSFSFEDRCIGIQQDEEGTVWIATRQNIYRFKNEYEGFEKLMEYSSTVTKYLSLLAGPQKKLYLLTTEGILRWNPAKNKMEPMGIAPFKGGGSFALLQFYGDWLFYRLSNTTVVRYNTVTGAQDSLQVQEPNYFVPLDADNVWMRQGIGNTALVSFKTKTVTPVNKTQFDEAFTDNNFFITAASEGRPGHFFTILNDKGHYSYNTATNRFKKINFFNNGKLLTGKPLLTRNNFFKEKEGTAWFTNEEGIFFLHPNTANVRLLRSTNTGNNDQWNNDVRNFAEDSNGNIWFSTGSGFCKWNKTNGKVSVWHPDYTATDYLNYSSVKAMGFSNSKVVIGQSEKGFWIFDPVKQTFSRPKFEADSLKKKFENGFNANMLQLLHGNFLVLSGGVWLIDKETFYVKPVKVPEAALSSRKAYEDAEGRIWMLGRNGIVAMDKKFTVLYSLDDKERGKWYNAIVQINENTFWVAARGLYEIKLQPQKQLSVKSIFPEFSNQHFSNLFKDSLGHIWMSSDDGMYRYIPEKHMAEKFDLSDNIQNFYAGVSNNFRGSDGTVYFGSLNGINYFVPEKIPLQNDSLQIQLLNVTVNKDDSSFLLHHSLQNLKHSQNVVAFDFIAPYLYNAEKIQYRYKLEGADKDWINLGNATSVRFNSLQPGSYAFQVAASLNGKDWYEMRESFSFTISPPFWKTWWFILLFLAGITALTVFLIKRRIQFIKKRESEKTELQKIKAANYQSKLETEQVINYFTASISDKNNIDDLLWDVAKNCISKLGFEDCVIYLADDEQKTLTQKAAWGPKTNEENKITNPLKISFGAGITGTVASNNKAEIIPDTTLDKRYIADDASRPSEICVPVSYHEKVLGVIDSEHSQKNFYTEWHLHLLTTISTLLAERIIKIRAQELAREKEIEVLTLRAANYQYQLETEQVAHFFSQTISQKETIDEMLEDVSKNLIGKLGFEDCMIYLWNDDKTILLQKAGYGPKGDMQAETDKHKYHVPAGRGIVGATAATKQSLLVNDTSQDSRYFTADEKIRLSELCVPIIRHDEVLGVINTEHSQKDFYTQRHLQILTTVASLLAEKMEKIKAEQQTREKEMEVLKLNKDLATSQLTTLRAQMNPHFIFNALNSIQQYVLQGNVVEANKYLSKFSKLQREVLNHSDQNFISLEKEIEVLALYLELEQLRFDGNFNYEVKIDAAIDVDEIKIPPMIIQPFVENSIWHGLMPKQGERWVHIHFELSSDDLLICTVTDNGIGRDASARLKQNGHGPHKSKGLSLVYDRLNILQQQYGQAFEVTIKDLVENNNVPTGTEVKLHIYIG